MLDHHEPLTRTAAADVSTSREIARPNAHELSYRPEIDGLRAVAVLGVVFYHVGLACPGGYVGVDIFFVISGFLITALLLRDFSRGTLSLVRFWERRARRILPAASVMVLVTLAVGSLVLLRPDFVSLGKSAVAQSLMLSNVFFLRQQGGYFSGLDIHPLLHTWSLAVEEQFYFFYPLALYGLYRLKRRVGPVLLGSLVAVLAGSLILAALFLPSRPSAVFFLLPFRAWELLCGGLLAALPAAAFSDRRWVREWVGWLGMALLIAPIFLYTKDTPFPGIAALPPCLGAMALIWSNTRTASGATLNSVGRMMASRPVVFVGLISYSLYLWHWPVIVFAQYGFPPLEQMPAGFKLAILASAFVLAVISWRFVETPFRLKTWAGTRREIFLCTGAASAAIVVLGFLGYRFGGLSHHLPGSLGEVMRANSRVLEDRGPFFNVSTEDVRRGNVQRFGDEHVSKSSVLLWGDSHARHVLPALDSLCHELGVGGEAIVYSSTPPLFNAPFDTDVGLDEASPEWAEAVLQRIRTQSIRHVILAAYWHGRQSSDRALLAKTLPETIRRLAAAGCSVWVLMDVPDNDVFPARALAREAIIGPSPEPLGRTPQEHREFNAVMYDAAAQHLPARFVDPSRLLLSPAGTHFAMQHNGVSLYYDKHHLTPAASRSLLLPLLRSELGVAIRNDGVGARVTTRSHPY